MSQTARTTTDPSAPAKHDLPTTAEPAPPPKRAFGRAYWMCNTIEMWERLAYYGIRSVVPIYIMQATEPGGLHMTAVHKGVVYAWWAVFQSWLPMFTGGVADRYGYKRVLFFAISANVVGYILMALLHSYEGFFLGILVLATGTAFFKPALQGTIAQNLTKETSSMGWGIFYWVVNVGAFGAPIIATLILGQPHSAEGWRNLFLASAAYTSVNLLLLLSFKDVPSGADKTEGIIKVFWRTVENICPYWFRGGAFDPKRWVPGLLILGLGAWTLIFDPLADWGWRQTALGWALCFAGVIFVLWLKGGHFTWQLRLPAFLLIMSCFWLMMYQLWDLHPNFIEDWVDSSMIAAHVPFSGWREYGDRGLIRVPQQILLNLNAGLIILLVIPISWLARKMRTLSSMLIGMTVATAGIVVAGMTGNGWILLLGIVFFSLGEMLTGPKKNEYLGLIAPPGKKGLYLGYVNIPIGLGVGIGSMIAGIVYDNYGEKATLALKHLGANPQLIARAARSADWSDSLERIPGLLGIERDQAVDVASAKLGMDRDQTTDYLLSAFRYDRGQITNLGLTHLALHPEFRERATAELARFLSGSSVSEQDQDVGRGLADGSARIEQIGVARFVHLLPRVLQISRSEVWEIVQDRMNRPEVSDTPIDDKAIVDRLWDQFAGDAQTQNNLALEFLAQGTDDMAAAVATMTFDDPVKELDRRLGIGRTKSFFALSAAMGADPDEVERTLADVSAHQTGAVDRRSFAYLMNTPHHRFIAIARRDWSNDVTALREFMESDPKVLAVVENEIVDGPAATLAERLADRPDLIQTALAEVDWTKSPDRAAWLLGLNPFEAQALVAAEINGAQVAATQMLWERYHPQYKVWLPFAAIGVIAAMALAIFGQMAKRWADMNA